jgi:Tfp pilus assembly protein PilF
MSLLMDALRKAEEAKKKAAHENKSEESAPAVEEQQAEAAVEQPPKPVIELSMAELDEVPTRAPVPSIDTPIEFEEEEEDYVLPTSIPSSPEGSSEKDAVTEKASVGEGAGVVEFEQNSVAADDSARRVDTSDEARESQEEASSSERQEPVAAAEPFELDSFASAELEDENNGQRENEENAQSEELEKVAPDIASPVAGGSRPGRGQGSRILVPSARLARERSPASDDPRQKTARNVFAAKKSPLANKKTTATIGLVLVIVVFAAYFYTSLNQESTFNIPAGNYATTEFVDNGELFDAEEEQISIDATSVAAVEDSPATDIALISTAEPVSASDNLNELASSAVTRPDTSTASPAVATVIMPEPRRNASNLQPELIEPEASRVEVVVTTIGAEDEVTSSAEPVIEAAVSTAAIDSQSSAPVETTSLISFTRQTSQATVDPNIERAYTAYQQGSLDQAETLYRQTLASDPRQRDALLGLASIAARKGDSTEALDLYSRLLARNPGDPIARAGLMELLPSGNASEQEAELKRLLSEHPNVAALSYAYGNFLASNQRWNEAQQTYFRALQLAKSDAATSGLVNPDYAFNLAVSLEHLNQSEPAQNYYREALEYSQSYPAGFDLSALRNRLASMAGSER